jgi:hypothetical protein
LFGENIIYFELVSSCGPLLHIYLLNSQEQIELLLLDKLLCMIFWNSTFTNRTNSQHL